MLRLLLSCLILIQKPHKDFERLNLTRGLRILILLSVQTLLAISIIPASNAWFDETHIAVAKVAGYSKWFNACGADMIKVKMGEDLPKKVAEAVRIHAAFFPTRLISEIAETGQVVMQSPQP
jgi:hypothetical protein